MMRRYTLGLGGREFVIDVQELSADRFEVLVEGQRYDVVVAGDEDLPDASITPAYLPGPGSGLGAPATAPPGMPQAPKATGAAMAAAAAAPARRSSSGGAATLSAPMPGVILEVHVKAGDVIRRGQDVAVLDAMKMHNLIGAPRDGTVVEVCVAPGQAVGHGDALIRFAPD